MNTLFIGNAISFVGCLIMVLIGFLKKKKHILVAQSVQCAFMGTGHLVLGGTSGFICNAVTILRNIVFVKYNPTMMLKIGFIVLQFLLSISSLSAGWIAWLPIIAAAIFTWNLDTTSAARLKVVILITQVLWLTYDMYYRNYVASAFDVMTMVSNIIGFFMVKKEN